MARNRLRLIISPERFSPFESGIPDHFSPNLKEKRVGDNKNTVDTVGLTWSVQPRAKGNAQIRFWFAGEPRSISTGHKSPDALSRSAQAKLIQKWLKDAPEIRTGPALFTEEIKRFLSLKYEGRKPSTLEAVTRDLYRLRMVLGVSEVSGATKRLCEARKDAMRGSMAASTWADFLSRAAKFFRWQVTEGNLKEDPLVNFQRPAQKERVRREDVWEPERYEGALSHLEDEDAEMLEVFKETGIDPGDFFHLDPSKHLVEAFDPKGKPFWKIRKLRNKAKSRLEVIDQPLSKRAVEILVSRRTRWYDLSRYKDSDSFGCAVRKKFHRAQLEAGFTRTFGIKALRHTFATYHANRYLRGEGGPPMEELGKWMGHAPGSTVLHRVYLHAESSGMYRE